MTRWLLRDAVALQFQTEAITSGHGDVGIARKRLNRSDVTTQTKWVVATLLLINLTQSSGPSNYYVLKSISVWDFVVRQKNLSIFATDFEPISYGHLNISIRREKKRQMWGKCMHTILEAVM